MAHAATHWNSGTKGPRFLDLRHIATVQFPGEYLWYQIGRDESRWFLLPVVTRLRKAPSPFRAAIEKKLLGLHMNRVACRGAKTVQRRMLSGWRPALIAQM
jgi:hypothetical protein